jgi:hypothetical protein
MTKPPRGNAISRTRWAHEFVSALTAANNEFGTTSDRVAVIVAVASIDRVLEMLLRHFFIATSGATQEECDFLLTKPPIPPIGSAGVRVRIAKCLGLVSEQEANALTFAIDWRNHFAHEPVAAEITEGVAQALMDRLPKMAREIIARADSELSDALGSAPRGRFVAACIVLHALLFLRADIWFGDLVPGERLD